MGGRLGRWLGFGPVFTFEWLTSSRRWHGYAQRAAFVGLLLASLFVVAYSRTTPTFPSRRDLAELGAQFYFAVIGTQLTLVLLAAPAATAGAICLDRARGTLTHLLVTDLSDSEIVLGKLASRLVPILGLVACALPVTSLLSLLGGVDPDALVGAFLVTVGVALLGCSLAMAFSLWAGKTHEALLGTYAVWGLWLLGPYMIPTLSWATGFALPTFPEVTDPFHLAFGPYTRPRSVAWTDYLIFLGGTSAISAALAGLAVWRLRSVCNREPTRVPRESAIRRWLHRGLPTFSEMARRLPGPSLDGNPVLWREWRRNRPSRWARIVLGIYFGVSGFFSLAVILGASRMLAPFVNGFQVSVGLLMLSVSAATALAEERVRGSLDVLMSTPLPTRQIVMGKWLGAFRGALFLSVLPPLVILLGGPKSLAERQVSAAVLVAFILAQGATVTSLGLVLATWNARLGRAVGLTVTIYVAITVGWMFLIMAIAPRPARNTEAIVCASAFMGAGGTTAEAFNFGSESWTVGTFAWTVLYAILACALLLTALGSFNRRLGRIERGLLWEWGGEVNRGRIARAQATAEPFHVKVNVSG
ncbi:MAG: ABC transporter permease subunit [Isosphaeraceae bacterium]